MIPPPTHDDLALDLEAEYAASDRDAMRRALIRRAAQLPQFRASYGVGIEHSVTVGMIPGGTIACCACGTVVVERLS